MAPKKPVKKKAKLGRPKKSRAQKKKESKRIVNRKKKKRTLVVDDIQVTGFYSGLIKRSLSRGRPLAYLPGELLAVFVEYVQYYEDNPLVEQKVFGTGLKANQNKIRAMHIDSFCIFAGIHRDAFNGYEKRPEFHDVTKYIKTAIKSQKFEGAAADMLNANLISKDLGLVDKTSIVDDEGKSVVNWVYNAPEQPKDLKDKEDI